MSIDIKERISTMGYLFVAEGLAMVDPSITAVDSTLIKAKGIIWHKSSIRRKEKYHVLALIGMPGGAIAIPTRDGFSDINYILHLQQHQGEEEEKMIL